MNALAAGVAGLSIVILALSIAPPRGIGVFSGVLTELAILVGGILIGISFAMSGLAA